MGQAWKNVCSLNWARPRAEHFGKVSANVEKIVMDGKLAMGLEKPGEAKDWWWGYKNCTWGGSGFGLPQMRHLESLRKGFGKFLPH